MEAKIYMLKNRKGFRFDIYKENQLVTSFNRRYDALEATACRLMGYGYDLKVTNFKYIPYNEIQDDISKRKKNNKRK